MTDIVEGKGDLRDELYGAYLDCVYASIKIESDIVQNQSTQYDFSTIFYPAFARLFKLTRTLSSIDTDLKERIEAWRINTLENPVEVDVLEGVKLLDEYLSAIPDSGALPILKEVN